MDASLSKPIQPELLLATVSQLLTAAEERPGFDARAGAPALEYAGGDLLGPGQRAQQPGLFRGPEAWSWHGRSVMNWVGGWTGRSWRCYTRSSASFITVCAEPAGSPRWCRARLLCLGLL